MKFTHHKIEAMKKIIIVMIIALMVGCGHDKWLEIEGTPTKVETCGLFIGGCHDCVEYRTVTGNVIWAVVLFPTVIAPVLLLGESMYEPVRVKERCKK